MQSPISNASAIPDLGAEQPAAEKDAAHQRRISTALFLAGFATFSLIYCTQPVLPEFAADFHISPAESSLAVSVTTVCLAISILCAGALSESLGRRGLMFASIALSATLNLLAAGAPTWIWLLIARTIEGITLGGIPAVAMAYLAEEVPRERLSFAMGLYVSGTAFGGMIGRVATGALTEAISWRGALAIVGVVDLIAALVFLALLPRSQNFTVRPGLSMRTHLAAWLGHLRVPHLPLLFLTGFLALGGFMTVLNYVGFRLSAAPYHLNQAQIGLIFFVFLAGIVASSWAGVLADRIGRGPVMRAGSAIFLIGLLITLMSPLMAVIVGTALATAGFFTVHSIASGWVGQLAVRDKGHASSLYLLAYYVGSSVLGSAGGWVWRSGGWSAVVGYCGILFGTVLAIASILRTADIPSLIASNRKP